jgi:hypothetical protein
MYITEVCSGVCKKAVISQVEPEDFANLTKTRYFFAWKSLRQTAAIYKLQIEGNDDILGVIALVDHPSEKRIEIKLIANSKENQGRFKQYDRIAGCLIAYACKLSADKYSECACVSLIPKTTLVNHYKQKYHMIYGGWQLYLESDALQMIIEKFAA